MVELSVLSGINAVKLRPGMYIGSTFTPDHLLQEVVDNALDELSNNYANTITIDIQADTATVTDNGRGMPNHLVNGNPEDPDNPRMIDATIAACTLLHSGAKFNNDAYDAAIGLHGVGLVAVNALSKSLTIITRNTNDKTIFRLYRFIDGKLAENRKITTKGTLINEEQDFLKKVQWNTYTSFVVDPQYFTMSNLNVQKIYDRMSLVSSKIPTCNIILNGNPIPKGSLEQFARFRLNIPEEVPLFHTLTNENKTRIDIFFTYDLTSNTTPIVEGDVNLHMCAGRYLTNFQTLIFNILNSKNNITRNESLSNLRAYISIIMPNPEFESQAKTVMGRDLSNEFRKTQKSIQDLFKSKYLKDCIESILQRKSIQRASKKVTTKKRVTAQLGFKDCLNTPGEYLYLMEGASADGSLSQIRKKKTEAIFPVTGKILNVVKNSVDKATDNKKFKYLLEILGVQLKNLNKHTKFRYNRVRILCDADPDGLHIAVLLTLGLWYYASQLIIQKRVSIILPPLYGAIKGKNFIPIYNTSQINNYPGYQITRFKGIGEMNPEQLEVVIRHNCLEYVLSAPTTQGECDNVIRCITDTELKRKLCEDKRFALETLFKFVNPTPK